jgi:hypothetical protein
VLERTQARTLPLLNRTPDLVPAAQACCGACRTCMTANVLTAITAAALFVAAPLVRLVRRVA